MSHRIPDPPDDERTKALIGAAIEVHRHLGPGLLEAVYEECLCHELALRRIPFQRQMIVPIKYKNMSLASPLRLDLVVHDSVIIEVKSTDRISGTHESQLVSYLRLSGREVGVIVNFNVSQLVSGLRRIRYFSTSPGEAPSRW